MLKYLLASAVSVAGALTFPASIQAEPINFRATLLVSCIIVVTDGALAPNGDYTLLSSENTGGLPAPDLYGADHNVFGRCYRRDTPNPVRIARRGQSTIHQQPDDI